MVFSSEITEIWEIAEQTIGWTIKKPQGFTFRAGQHVSLKLSRLAFPDDKGPRRTFTIASAPQEDDLMFVTRNTGSGFKRTLLHGAQPIELWGPMGGLVWEGNRAAVFIAGGVGISPFRSMILESILLGSAQSMILLHSDRTSFAAVFSDFFRKMKASFPQIFSYRLFLTQTPPFSRIDSSALRSALDELSHAVFYLCGSEGFVNAMLKMLSEIGVDSSRVRHEVFRGYTKTIGQKEGE